MATRTVIHPLPPGMQPSAEWLASVDGMPAAVHRQLGFAGGTVGWVSYDADGPHQVRLLPTRNLGRSDQLRCIDRVEVLPASAGASARLQPDGSILLQVPGPCRLTIRCDGDWSLPLHLFCNPPCGPPPAGARVFGPGVHRPGVIRLAAGECLWLEPGSLVHGIIRAHDADAAVIGGRGILCGSAIPHGGSAEFPNPLVEFRRCRGARIEGITLLDSFGWTLVAHDCDGWRVANVKLLNERGWSTDGINPCDCRDAVIEDCFARCKDDCVSIKGLHDQADPGSWTPIQDITVRRCVFWSDNNNALVVGSETRASRISGIRFEDIDILRTVWSCGDDAGALAVICLDDTVVEDIAFERIRIVDCGGPPINVFIADEIFGIPGSRRPGGMAVSGLRFADIEVLGGRGRRSFLRGLDPGRRIAGVRLERITLHGRGVATPDDLRLVREHADGIIIT